MDEPLFFCLPSTKTAYFVDSPCFFCLLSTKTVYFVDGPCFFWPADVLSNSSAIRRVSSTLVNGLRSASSTVSSPLRCLSQHRSTKRFKELLSSQSKTTPVFVVFSIMDMAPSGCPMPRTGLHDARYSKSFPGSTALYSGSLRKGRIRSEAQRCC